MCLCAWRRVCAPMCGIGGFKASGQRTVEGGDSLVTSASHLAGAVIARNLHSRAAVAASAVWVTRAGPGVCAGAHHTTISHDTPRARRSYRREAGGGGAAGRKAHDRRRRELATTGALRFHFAHRRGIHSAAPCSGVHTKCASAPTRTRVHSEARPHMHYSIWEGWGLRGKALGRTLPVMSRRCRPRTVLVLGKLTTARKDACLDHLGRRGRAHGVALGLLWG